MKNKKPPIKPTALVPPKVGVLTRPKKLPPKVKKSPPPVKPTLKF